MYILLYSTFESPGRRIHPQSLTPHGHVWVGINMKTTEKNSESLPLFTTDYSS